MEEEVSTTDERGKSMNYYCEEEVSTAIILSGVAGFLIGVVSMFILVVIVWL